MILQAHLDQVRTFDESLAIALRFIRDNRNGREVCFISHPISPTAGRSQNENLESLRWWITHFERQEYYVFNQIPFLSFNLVSLVRRDTGAMFEEFFGPLFTSGEIDKVAFVGKWKGSIGCLREHAIIEDLDIKKIFP